MARAALALVTLIVLIVGVIASSQWSFDKALATDIVSDGDYDGGVDCVLSAPVVIPTQRSAFVDDTTGDFRSPRARDTSVLARAPKTSPPRRLTRALL
jgi:hypothetical protein